MNISFASIFIIYLRVEAQYEKRPEPTPWDTYYMDMNV